MGFSSFIQVPFLNLMGQLQHRAGAVHIRCGGNTQEFATYVEHLDHDAAIAKERANLQNPVRLNPRFSFRLSHPSPSPRDTFAPSLEHHLL